MSTRVSLLGGFAAEAEGAPVLERAWRLRKARELVKLLALAPGHRLHREQVMDALWRDRKPASAANNLYQAVHAARRALGRDAIKVQNELVHLAAEVDVDDFESLAKEARRSRSTIAYDAALSAYGGELLPENRYDDWVIERREQLEGLVAELRREADAIESVAPRRRSPLPADSSSFIGRERELAELAVLLTRTRCLSLTGTGGVGKTRLAIELARAADRAFEGGSAFVELAMVSDSKDVADAVAVALDIRPLPGRDIEAVLAAALVGRSQLLVLDNCEHVVVSVSSLAAMLLRAAPDLTILATSREPLRMPGEIVFRVPSLDIPDPDGELAPDWSKLLDVEAVRLFVDRAAAVSPGFQPNGHNVIDIARICFRLDGLPLAVELAAGRIGALDPSDIAIRLDDRFRLLRRGGHGAPTRQHALHATLQWSHDLLDPDERVLFRRLAVFAGGFRLDAVEDVCAGGLVSRARVADVLGRLVEKSLVAVDDSEPRERRYRLLDTVQLFARDRLRDAGELDELAEGHAGWALGLAESAAADARLDRDVANLRMALDTLVETAPADAVRMCVALGPFWLRRIELREARRRFDEVLAASASQDALRCEALLAAAAIDMRSGDVAHAIALVDECRQIAGEIGEWHLEWRALQMRGEIAFAQDTPGVAISWLEEARDRARANAFQVGEAIGVFSIGVAYWAVGRLDEAERHVADSVSLFRSIPSTASIPSPLNFAEIRSDRLIGRARLPLVFEDTLQPYAELSRDGIVGYALANQAGIAQAGGDRDRALALLDQSRDQFAGVGDDRGLAAVLVRRAYLDLSGDDPAQARAHLQEALALRRSLGDRRGIGLALAGLGLVETALGELSVAEGRLAEACDLFRQAGDRWGLASTLWRNADLEFERGSLDRAERALLEALDVLCETGRTRWVATTLVGLAEVESQRGHADRAASLLVDARSHYASGSDDHGVADVDARLQVLRDRS